jgi:hypothetical protein
MKGEMCMRRKYPYIILGLVVLAVIILIILYTCNLFPFSSGLTSQGNKAESSSQSVGQEPVKPAPKTQSVQETKKKLPADTPAKEPAKVEKTEAAIPAEQFNLLLEYGGHQYYLSVKSTTWTDAENICLQYGGHLVTITSDAENQALIQAMKAKKIVKDIWVGFTDRKQEGKWEWVTGEKSDFTFWDFGQPDNYGGRNEQYGMIFRGPPPQVKPYGWHDFINNERPAYFILEKE